MGAVCVCSVWNLRQDSWEVRSFLNADWEISFVTVCMCVWVRVCARLKCIHSKFRKRWVPACLCVHNAMCSMTQKWRAGLVVMMRQWAKNMEVYFTGCPNHITHIHKVWDPFCKSKWIGICKRLWQYSWLTMFMSEGHIGDISTPRLYFQPNNQIWCRDVQLRYFPSTGLRLCGWACLYIFKY